MAKKGKSSYPVPGGAVPIADAPPKPKGRGATPNANKLPRHALHARGRNRGM